MSDARMLAKLPYQARIAALMDKRIPWWRTYTRSVKRRGPLALALDYRSDYVRGARGLKI